MRLIIGGYGQGKLSYALKQLPEDSNIEGKLLILNEEQFTLPSDLSEMKYVIVNHLHEIIRRMKDLEAIRAWLQSLIACCDSQQVDLQLICDEVGCGVVPMDPESRNFREQVGRVQCELAGAAEDVHRLVCGIAQKIK